ncbi:MAG: restriction endonuclease [Bacillota bacterium]|nr:restriction endonuclease [Bacillota bacterium]
MEENIGLLLVKTIYKSLPGAVAALMPVILMMGAVVLIKTGFLIYQKRKLSESGILEIDKMSGKTFEKYLEALFEKLGYQVERTRYVGDYGADLITYYNGVKTVIQAKRYKGKVGIKAIQEAVAAKGYYDCSAVMVVTNSYYTKQAYNLAKANSVELWNRTDLIAALTAVKRRGEVLDQLITASNSRTEIAATSETYSLDNLQSCVVCGKVVSDKVRDYCLSKPNRFGGKIYCYDHQRN